MLTLTSFPSDLFQRHLLVMLAPDGDVSRTLAVFRIELFVTLFNGFQLLDNVRVSFVLFAMGVLDSSLLD